MVAAVADWPVPASTGMRPPTWATAARSSMPYSSSDRAAASPVEPATTTPELPPSTWAASRRDQASRSSRPSGANGLASAVMLPERNKARTSSWLPAMLLAAGKRRQVCWPRASSAAFRRRQEDCFELYRRAPDRQREPPADQRVHHASAVAPAGSHPSHLRQRMQPAGRAPVHGWPRRLGDGAGGRFLGRGGQARGHADP